MKFINRKWKSPSSEARKKMSPSCFLDPKEKKYPVKKTPTSPYNVRALVRAISLAHMHNEPEIAKKAEKLLEEHRQLKKKGK